MDGYSDGAAESDEGEDADENGTAADDAADQDRIFSFDLMEFDFTDQITIKQLKAVGGNLLIVTEMNSIIYYEEDRYRGEY